MHWHPHCLRARPRPRLPARPCAGHSLQHIKLLPRLARTPTPTALRRYMAMCAAFPSCMELCQAFSSAFPAWAHLHFWVPGRCARQGAGERARRSARALACSVHPPPPLPRALPPGHRHAPIRPILHPSQQGLHHHSPTLTPLPPRARPPRAPHPHRTGQPSQERVPFEAWMDAFASLRGGPVRRAWHPPLGLTEDGCHRWGACGGCRGCVRERGRRTGCAGDGSSAGWPPRGGFGGCHGCHGCTSPRLAGGLSNGEWLP